ncbi:MAG: tryptophan 7-halogenase [Glaciecola sp.]|jgi:flavin-dependent dehydrogenase
MPHPDLYFLTTTLAQQNKTPAHEHPELKTNYGYHFDSAKLGQFLKAHGTQQGIQVIATTIDSIQHQANTIVSVTDEQGQLFNSDCFFDCTGFAGQLIQETLGTEFIP